MVIRLYMWYGKEQQKEVMPVIGDIHALFGSPETTYHLIKVLCFTVFLYRVITLICTHIYTNTCTV